jgi:hypothetical protein
MAKINRLKQKMKGLYSFASFQVMQCVEYEQDPTILQCYSYFLIMWPYRMADYTRICTTLWLEEKSQYKINKNNFDSVTYRDTVRHAEWRHRWTGNNRKKIAKKKHTHIQKKSLTLFSPILVFSLNKKDQTGHDIAWQRKGKWIKEIKTVDMW